MDKRDSPVGLTDPPRYSVTSKLSDEITWRDEYTASPRRRKRAVEAATAARKSCRELASELHTVLPRELRNMVYTYIVGPSAQLEHSFDSHGSIQIGFSDPWGPEDLGRLSMFGESGQMQPKSWAMDPAYFGTDVAKELAEAYYTSNRFSLTWEEVLGPFLTANPFALGIKPYEHIRRLDLTLDFEYLHDVDFTSTATHLQALQLVPCRQCKMDICINLTTSFKKSREHYYDTKFWYRVEDERIMLNILELLRWPVYDLLHKGHAIQVFHENLDEGNRTSQEIAQRDLTRYRFTDFKVWYKNDFFYMTKEEWLKEKGENTVADPASHFILPLPTIQDENQNADQVDENSRLEQRVREALKRRWDRSCALNGFDYAYDNDAYINSIWKHRDDWDTKEKFE